MRSEDLHDMIHATPFRSFEIRLPDRQRVEVIHPDWIAPPRRPGRGRLRQRRKDLLRRRGLPVDRGYASSRGFRKSWEATPGLEDR